MTSKQSGGLAARPLSLADSITALWFVVDGMTHLFLEGSYLLLAFGGGAKYYDGLTPWIWKEYSKADKRWEVRDATVMSLELLTVCVMGPLALLVAYGIVYRRPWRHFAQVVISTSELYGGCMTFFPEWIDGSPNLVTDRFKYKWVYLFFMNGVWVWIPAILLWDSGKRITDACYKAKTELHDEGGVSKVWHVTNGVILLVYFVAVPYIILFTP
eukprot:comp22989_c1_seq1/m.36597 comp22989_c1_seq1/g.36597  ORF comp22989_c1_seq1/g.36597 comp22989_c1_seq1/m.36597 type:complete len:214 (-) comp22989_c1_seq1:402-1043(-)